MRKGFANEHGSQLPFLPCCPTPHAASAAPCASRPPARACISAVPSALTQEYYKVNFEYAKSKAELNVAESKIAKVQQCRGFEGLGRVALGKQQCLLPMRGGAV